MDTRRRDGEDIGRRILKMELMAEEDKMEKRRSKAERRRRTSN